MNEPIRCGNCGAAMAQQLDCRLYACPYCGAEVQVAIDGAQIAAGLRRDLAHAESFLAGLADALRAALPELTQVQAEGELIVYIELNLEPDVFIARREVHRIVAQHRKLVRGVALRTATHPLDHWLDLLTQALARYAHTSAQATLALARIRGA